MARALLLTGTLASGKTAVAVEMGWILSRRGLAVAVVDLDWLAWVHPTALGWDGARTDRLIADNLASLAANYLAAGIDHLVLARTVIRPPAIELIRAALPASELRVIRLRASSATIEARLRHRDSGRELEEHLGEYARYADLVAAVPADAEVDNEGASAAETAARVVSLAGW